MKISTVRSQHSSMQVSTLSVVVLHLGSRSLKVYECLAWDLPPYREPHVKHTHPFIQSSMSVRVSTRPRKSTSFSKPRHLRMQQPCTLEGQFDSGLCDNEYMLRLRPFAVGTEWHNMHHTIRRLTRRINIGDSTPKVYVKFPLDPVVSKCLAHMFAHRNLQGI